MKEKSKLEFIVVNLSREYPGLVGDMKYAVITYLPEEELMERYGSELEQYRPFIIMEQEIWQAFHESHLNDSKFQKRYARKHDLFHTEDEDWESAVHTEESPVENAVIAYYERNRMKQAMEVLTKKQRKRIRLRYEVGLTLEQIANIEQSSAQSIDESIRAGLKKMKKFLKTP